MEHGKPVIGLTGGIGAGKSTIARFLEEEGCVVTKSDQLARQALMEPEIRKQLIDWWGRGILDEQGEINRKAVASIVFNDSAERKRLESVVHPWVEARRREQFAAAPPDAPALVIDAPLLMEAGLVRECDAVIFVEADRRLRLDRVRRERGWDEPEMDRREDSQWPLDVKRRRADHIVVNNGDLGELKDAVRRILTTIVQTAEAR